MSHVVNKIFPVLGRALKLLHLLLNRLGHLVEISRQLPDFILRFDGNGVVFPLRHPLGHAAQAVDASGQKP